jgi:hypothetical protein
MLQARIQIENARLYPAAIVDELRAALSNGTNLRADETRKNFYDLDIEGRTFFIYISAASGNVTLIAMWPRRPSMADTKSEGPGSWWRWFTTHPHAT